MTKNEYDLGWHAEYAAMMQFSTDGIARFNSEPSQIAAAAGRDDSQGGCDSLVYPGWSPERGVCAAARDQRRARRPGLIRIMRSLFWDGPRSGARPAIQSQMSPLQVRPLAQPPAPR